MTLSTTDSRFSYDGDAVTVAFSYPRKVIEASHLKVYVYDEDDDSMTLQTLNTHYTFSGSGLSNGIYASATLTFVTAPGTDKKVIIFRDPTLTQEFDFTSETNVLNALNRFADRVEMKLQRADDRLDRAWMLPDGDYQATLSNTYAKADYASKVLGFDSSGNPQPVANDGASTTVTGSEGGTELLSDWFKRMARGTDYPDVAYGYHTDRSANGDTAFPLRIQDRVFLGTAATGEEGATIASGHTVTWLSSSFDHYFARSATLLSISPMGGAGGVFATRRGTDSYDGNAVWTSGEAVTIGTKRGYINSDGSQSLYTATTAGTTGATPPTHTTGTASDGAVTWQFTQLQYRTAMGFASLAYNNAADGGAAWGGYIEAYRAAGAGYTHGLEIDIKNGGSNVEVHPYSISTAGATDALNLAAGPTQYGPSAANPVSAAILFQSNGSTTFNKGLVFESTSLTDQGGGIYLPLNLFVGCHIRQYVSDGTTGSAIQFNVTANNERVALALQNRAIALYCQGATMGTFESIPAAGTAPDNYVALSAHAAADGYVQIRPAGTSTDVTLSLRGKGAAEVNLLRDEASTDTAIHVASLRRRTTGTAAIGIGSLLAHEIENASGTDKIACEVGAISTNVTAAAEAFDYVIRLMAGGAAAAEVARFTSDKKFKLPAGSVIDLGAGDLTITPGTNTLAFAGATTAAGGYTFDADVFVSGKAVWRTLAASAVQIVRNSVNGAGDATETVQVTVAVPAGAMGANGRLRITWMGTCTNSANVKTWNVRFGASGAGTGGQAYYTLAATNQASIQHQIIIRNRNSASSQVGYSNAVAAIFGQTTTALKTSAINTAADSEVVISNNWAGATASEAMNVEDYHVEVMYGA